MRRFGQVLMILGAAVGVLVVVAMLAHWGVAGPWLVNVALAKLTLLGAVGLMAGGAVSIRLAARREQRRLSGPPS
jgi:Zn-dependent protease